jgi:hypothetical protein
MNYYQKYNFKYLNLLLLNYYSGNEIDTDKKYKKLIEGVPADELKNINENKTYTAYDKYFQICIKAIKNNSLALQYVEQDKLNKDNNDYGHLCYLAVKKNGLALEYVNSKKIKESFYILCCKIAVEQDPTALQYVQSLSETLESVILAQELPMVTLQSPKKTKPEKYKEICNLAVKKDNITDSRVSFGDCTIS